MIWHVLLNAMASFTYTLNGIVGEKISLKSPCLKLYLINKETQLDNHKFIIKRTAYLKNMIIFPACNQHLKEKYVYKSIVITILRSCIKSLPINFISLLLKMSLADKVVILLK